MNPHIHLSTVFFNHMVLKHDILTPPNPALSEFIALDWNQIISSKGSSKFSSHYHLVLNVKVSILVKLTLGKVLEENVIIL